MKVSPEIHIQLDTGFPHYSEDEVQERALVIERDDGIFVNPDVRTPNPEVIVV